MFNPHRVNSRPGFPAGVAACFVLGVAACLPGLVSPAAAAVPETMSFQGILVDDAGVPLADGQHDLHVRLYGSSGGGSAPLWEEQQTITTSSGQFHVVLGTVNPLSLPFDQTYWISTEVDGQGEMSPRVPLTGSPYALTTRSVDDGGAVRSLNGLTDEVTLTGNGGISVTEVGSSIVIDGSGGTGGDSDWLIDGDDMYAIPTGKIGVGTDAPGADLHVWDDGGATTLYIEDATPGVGFHDAQIRLYTPYGYGMIEYFTAGSPPEPTLNISGGAENPMNIKLNGRSLKFDTDEDYTFQLNATDRMYFNSVGQLVLKRDDGTTTTSLLASEPYARFFMYQGDGQEGLDLSSGASYGAHVEGRKQDGSNGFLLRAERSSANDGAYLSLYDGQGSVSAIFKAMHDGSSGTAGGEIALYPNGSNDHTVQLIAQESGSSTQGGQITIHNDSGLSTVVMDGDHGSSNAGNIQMRDAAGNVTIDLDADAGGEGRITTDVLEITAGSDLSERFDVRGTAAEETPRPGMVVSIDVQRPGELTLAARPYDTRVAGVISGAGGVKPGLLMGQRVSIADGDHPVALTGRVYVRADASFGTIEPGDLLTTSGRPGFAMKATDRTRTPGAVLGKAMTGLDEGQGLVLALVSLQ